MIQVIATSDETKNILVVKAPEEIQSQIKKMIEILDSPTTSKKLYIKKIQYLSATDLATIINNILKYKNSSGVCVGENKTNKLVLLEDENKIKDLIDVIIKIDQKSNLSNPSFIIKLKNAKSNNIANLLGGLK